MALKFFVTTPIYYVNDVPHIGHAYATLAADVLALWHRLQGHEVFFLTGLDENSVKTVHAARDRGFTDLQAYTDAMAARWRATWAALHISNDDFIRTTEARHKQTVVAFFQKIWAKGDIYKGNYDGLYCEDCEQFYTPKDLDDGLCPFHRRPPVQIVEENYFFRLSKYQTALRTYIETHPAFIQPEARRNEVLSFLQEELRDVSISRPNLEWGIDLPVDPAHKFWVWFDALINYISADPARWPATVQVIGKDILRFHCVIWPAMLMSAGYPLPRTIFVHGFFTIDGQKISKSLGNAVDPLALVQAHGLDAFRYFLFREIPFGGDGDFSEAALVQRRHADLADNLGNLVNRVLVLVEREWDGVIPPVADEASVGDGVSGLPARVAARMDAFQFHTALAEIWQTIAAANKYVNDTTPWQLPDKGVQGQVLYNLLETLRIVAIVLQPFMPETAAHILEQLGLAPQFSLQDATWGGLHAGTKIHRGPLLFPKDG